MTITTRIIKQKDLDNVIYLFVEPANKKAHIRHIVSLLKVDGYVYWIDEKTQKLKYNTTRYVSDFTKYSAVSRIEKNKRNKYESYLGEMVDRLSEEEKIIKYILNGINRISGIRERLLFIDVYISISHVETVSLKRSISRAHVYKLIKTAETEFLSYFGL